ncbi:prepilin-type N-terminal cleavage/methylation domain-containing protein [Luteolibacter flavescens]|uniref:Prepilin-type N-terminal cleavage/methylation domain-containing protein n=1 Tax=Luteolibacter flavescens TaxID=1859460 RepID=A0ABT3FQN7_9BACT|nr:prepilin-type N-terminal cleavage/methylation domain-containing protein [Luteolibacter flavescens]MCW1885893.1 prepilin-type N-terminal cleavage/methylation domain-containing protein [Luteolibacter flavescens]
MKFHKSRIARGFTLMETVIAIGVLALLLTAFLAVFGPATSNLRRAISVQEADRLASALERELVTVRPGSGSTSYSTGFDKAYEWIKAAPDKGKEILLYQYRGDPTQLRSDGTMEPFTRNGGVAGKDFIVQPAVRQRNDGELLEDLKALDGRIFSVKLTQLVFSGGQLTRGTAGEINDPTPDDGDSAGTGSGSSSYPEAVIAFAAEFFIVPNSSVEFVGPNGKFDASTMTKPVFTRNLAVRR